MKPTRYPPVASLSPMTVFKDGDNGDHSSATSSVASLPLKSVLDDGDNGDNSSVTIASSSLSPLPATDRKPSAPMPCFFVKTLSGKTITLEWATCIPEVQQRTIQHYPSEGTMGLAFTRQVGDSQNSMPSGNPAEKKKPKQSGDDDEDQDDDEDDEEEVNLLTQPRDPTAVTMTSTAINRKRLLCCSRSTSISSSRSYKTPTTSLTKKCAFSSSFAPSQLLPVVFALLVVVVSWTPSCLAFVPPKPGTELAATYEPVALWRQRRNITYNFVPKLLHPELCRHLTEAECEQADTRMQEHALRHRALQKELYQQRQRHLQSTATSSMGKSSSTTTGSTKVNHINDMVKQSSNSSKSYQSDQKDFEAQLGVFTRTYLAGNPPTLEEELAELEELLREFNTTRDKARRHLQSVRSDQVYNPSVGAFVVPVLLLKFKDHETRKLPDKYEYQILWNLRIRKWIEENSYGRYQAFFDFIMNWTLTDNTEEYYSFGESGRVTGLQEAFYPLLNEIDTQLNGDWSIYDADGDGYIDNMIILHSGYAAEEAGVDCTNGRTTESRIWSHAFPDAGEWVSPINGNTKLRGYMISSALDLVCDSNVAKMGVMTHEYMHTFFLIDLYDTNFQGKGVGNYDIMAYPYGVANDGYIPMNMSPWSKNEIEWQECTKITSSGEYALEPAGTSDACYHITLNDAAAYEEYILLENRQKTNFDINFWSSGLVMYHIDDGAQDQQWTGYPDIDPDWPASGDHYRVAVIQADGNYDLEKGINLGDAGDVWQPGMQLTPNNDGNTYPNTDSYQYGEIQATGITIEVLENEGMNVRFKVTFGARSASFGAPQKEENPHLHHHPSEASKEQSTAATSSMTVSGKIPQLPWYDEWKLQEQHDAILAEQGQERPEPAASQHVPGNELRQPIDRVSSVGRINPGLGLVFMILFAASFSLEVATTRP